MTGRRLEWGEVWRLRGEVEVGHLRGQVVDFGHEIFESGRDVDA